MVSFVCMWSDIVLFLVTVSTVFQFYGDFWFIHFRKQREVVHIDAWPINFFDTSAMWTSDDVTSQFLLQLSTVLLMVRDDVTRVSASSVSKHRNH